MPSRRAFPAGGAVATVLPLAACGQPREYDAAADRLRAPLTIDPAFAELVRFATLRPNGHNTQPWRFASLAGGARIAPDPTRRTPAVDPDDHHLFVSLGAAAETFAIASEARGRPAAIAFDPAGHIDLDTAAGPARDDPLFAAIPHRQSTRSEFDGRSVKSADLDRLVVGARIDGVSLTFVTDPARRTAVTDFVVAGNSAQLDDPTFVDELEHWVRFNAAAAEASGDGLFSRCSGQPTLPTWLGRTLFRRFLTKDSDNAKYVKQMRSSAGVAVFVGDRADPDHWVRVGRSFQRFALTATVLGIRTAMVNQPIEVPAVRADFARSLGAGGLRPDLVVRFGYAPPLPFSLRRPARAVIARCCRLVTPRLRAAQQPGDAKP